jgi:hypothetical protein
MKKALSAFIFMLLCPALFAQSTEKVTSSETSEWPTSDASLMLLAKEVSDQCRKRREVCYRFGALSSTHNSNHNHSFLGSL